jgi:hypothetical protein
MKKPENRETWGGFIGCLVGILAWNLLGLSLAGPVADVIIAGCVGAAVGLGVTEFRGWLRRP